MITIVHERDCLGQFSYAETNGYVVHDTAYLCGIRKPRYPVPAIQYSVEYMESSDYPDVWIVWDDTADVFVRIL